VSYLKSKGYISKIIDLNIEYYIYVLNKNYLQNALNKAYSQKDELFKYLSRHFKQGLTPENYTDIFKSRLLKYNKIKEFQSNPEKINNAINKIDYSIKVMKDSELFYSPAELTNAMANIDFCLEIASLPYFPALIQMGNYSDPFFKLDFDCMLKYAQSDNMFLDFYKNRIDDIISQKPDLIGISINSTTQIVSALTLALELKKKKCAKIIIGGNFFSRLQESIEKHPDFFKYFCDYLMLEEGETPNLELCRYLEGEISIKDVPNLMYLENKKVIQNPMCKPLEMSEQVVSDLGDFKKDNYLTPEIVIPMQSSRGCYWGKCSFCDHDYGQKLSIKKTEQFVSELKTIIEKYNINHFEFIDECISPSYLEKMSEIIAQNNLEVRFFNNARLENEFSEEILKKAYNAGLRMLLWGFESASEKIMKAINKGIDVNKRSEILKRAKEAGIWNFLFIFFGFPTETKEDAQETIDFIKNKTDLISSYCRSFFTLGKHTTLRQTPETFSITKIYKDKEEFSPSYHFETSVGMNEKEINEISDKCLKECAEAYNKPLWMYLFYREILFLYICKYGANKLAEMKIS
ncbi:radical SAM protein, partial [bacterium]|nr:radical SAM protein [bacterium]